MGTIYQKTGRIVSALTQQDSTKEYNWTILNKIRRDSITLRRLYECECNGCTRERPAGWSWSDYDKVRIIQMAWVEKRIEAVRSRIERNCKALGLHYYHQTDPRGCALYVSNNPISDNSYSTSSVAIY